jgi:hypothetical protein
MTPEQLLLQLGISGAVLFVGYQIALVLLRNWREAEKERTQALSHGLKALVDSHATIGAKVDGHHTMDIESHRELGEGLVAIQTKLDEARWYREEFTPVNQPIPTRTNTPARGVVTTAGTRHPRRGTHHDEER